VEFKEVGEDWSSSNTRTQRIPGSESRATVTGLWPSIAYHLRLYAENTIGKSEAGPILHAITEIEVPAEAPSDVIAEPLGSKAIKISWRPPYGYRSPPPSKSHSSVIKGYYVGFKPVYSSSSVFSYKTFDIEDGKASLHPAQQLQSKFSKDMASYETVISNLEKMTKYAVIVKAFNRKGSGPASDEIFVTTSDTGNYRLLLVHGL